MTGWRPWCPPHSSSTRWSHWSAQTTSDDLADGHPAGGVRCQRAVAGGADGTLAGRRRLFDVVGVLAVCAVQRLRAALPLTPKALAGITPDSAFNTAVSLVTNTNWQGDAGESTMSQLTQMPVLAVQNFLSAATGMAVAFALVRGFPLRPTERCSAGRCRIAWHLALSSRGQHVLLTPGEYKLLAALAEHERDTSGTQAEHEGQVLTHRHLRCTNCGAAGSVEHSPYLRIYMGHLRRKLEADLAQPVHLLTETRVGTASLRSRVAAQ